MSNILKPLNFLSIITRNIGKNRGKVVYNYKGEGIKFTGFTYYPRHPDHQDPPYEPTKLFRVQRIKPVKGTPYWERTILKELKLTGKASDVAIVKNIPEVNARLWKIKHLISIQPISFPNGFPNDTTGTYLQENGELKVIQSVNEETRLQLTENIQKETKRMDGDTLRRQSRIKWLSGWQ